MFCLVHICSDAGGVPMATMTVIGITLDRDTPAA